MDCVKVYPFTTSTLQVEQLHWSFKYDTSIPKWRVGSERCETPAALTKTSVFDSLVMRMSCLVTAVHQLSLNASASYAILLLFRQACRFLVFSFYFKRQNKKTDICSGKLELGECFASGLQTLNSDAHSAQRGVTVLCLTNRSKSLPSETETVIICTS